MMKKNRSRARRVVPILSKDIRKRLLTRISMAGIDMTPEDILERFFKIGGACEICRETLLLSGPASGPLKKHIVQIDHDHFDGTFRGLICSRCNMAIGGLLDSPTLMRRAAHYIERKLDPDRRDMAAELVADSLRDPLQGS